MDMDNQHKHIKGYRDLSQAEIDLMNEIKTKGEELREMVAKIEAVVAATGDAQPGVQHEADHPLYWLRYADGAFRTGVMFAVRAVARPTTY
jgi:hypothetical protein